MYLISTHTQLRVLISTCNDLLNWQFNNGFYFCDELMTDTLPNGKQSVLRWSVPFHLLYVGPNRTHGFISGKLSVYKLPTKESLNNICDKWRWEWIITRINERMKKIKHTQYKLLGFSAQTYVQIARGFTTNEVKKVWSYKRRERWKNETMRTHCNVECKMLISHWKMRCRLEIWWSL